MEIPASFPFSWHNPKRPLSSAGNVAFNAGAIQNVRFNRDWIVGVDAPANGADEMVLKNNMGYYSPGSATYTDIQIGRDGTNGNVVLTDNYMRLGLKFNNWRTATVSGNLFGSGQADYDINLNQSLTSLEANWDANTALNVTATVIQQHPDLCASIGFWGIMESGAAQAIRNAGKIDDVKVYASGEGSQLDCDQINSGNFYKFLSYKATEQGHDLMMAAQTLLQSGDKPGTKNLEYYTQPIWLDKTNASGANCFALPKKS